MGVPIESIRNIGILAHIDAGKTTATERMLFYTGKTRRMGEVDAGDSQMDWMALERERGISITAAATTCHWRGHQVNIIDTPGHVDFTVEVERSLRILDGAVAIFCAASGVQSQSEAVWRRADRYRVPRLVFVNKMDRRGADFNGVLEEVRTKLGANAVAVQMPLGQGEDFRGVVDLLRMEALLWDDRTGDGSEFAVEEVPPQAAAEAGRLRDQLLERLADQDNDLLRDVLEERVPEEQALRDVLRRATLRGSVFPVLCGAAYRNKGIQPLLDAVCDYLPSPRDVRAGEAAEAKPAPGVAEAPEADPEGPLAALAFKVATDAFAGKLVYVRVYSGRLHAGRTVYNASRGSSDRVAKLFRMHANRREELRVAEAGDIVAASGLRQTTTGDTLCEAARPLLLESMAFPEPVVSVVLEPRTQADASALEAALARLLDEDPTFRLSADTESGQTVLAGMGELHIEILVERLSREYGVRVRVGRPQVAYREAVSRLSRAEAVFDRQDPRTGERRYARVVLEGAPEAEGTAFSFRSRLDEGVLPAALVQAVRDGVEGAGASGVLNGYPVVASRVALVDAGWQPGRSDESSFRVCAAMALRRVLECGAAVLLEPMMQVEVVVPSDVLGPVIADLIGRSGAIEGIEESFEGEVVTAVVPMRTMFGAATSLRSETAGRAMFSLRFREYARMPGAVQREVLGTKNG